MSRFRRAKRARRSKKSKGKAKTRQKAWQDYLDGEPEAVARATKARRRRTLTTVVALCASQMWNDG